MPKRSKDALFSRGELAILNEHVTAVEACRAKRADVELAGRVVKVYRLNPMIPVRVDIARIKS